MSALHASPGTLQVNNGMLCYRGICSRPVSVCLSVRPSQADIVMKRLDESSWFLAHRLPIYPTVCCCIIRKSGYLQKLGYFPQRLCATFRTLKISPRQVDRVVNSNGRRRRRSHTHTHTRARAHQFFCLERGADLHMAQPMPLHSLSLASEKSRLVLPFWYRLTREILDKGPLNECL